MSFDYDKLTSNSGKQESWWVAYADLYVMLTVVFMLMYVTSSLRSGSTDYQQQTEYKKITQQKQDLEEQIKIYNTLKDEQLKKQGKDEEKVYAQLMDKLYLLKEDAKNEKEKLRQQAKENEAKEFALNKYQQIVRNIVNANILAKAQIERKDEIITERDISIAQQQKEILGKKKKIDSLETVITENDQIIAEINTQLEKKIAEVSDQQKRANITKKEMLTRIEQLKEESKVKIGELEDKRALLSMDLKETKTALNSAETQLADAGATIEDQAKKNEKLILDLQDSKARFVADMSKLKSEQEGILAAEKEAFEKKLEKQRLSASEKAKQLKKFADLADRKSQDLQDKLTGLDSKVKSTEDKLKTAEKEKGRFMADIGSLQKERKDILEDLAKTRARANARKEMANEIKKTFENRGVKAAVDSGTGDVTLDFGEEYFETGSAALKERMKGILDKFFPAYTYSLFNNPKTAGKIANVEIIGFASSTYRGKYVNPSSIRPEDRDAIKYNLTLSYSRAKSIFSHILNENVLSDSYKQKLLPLLKVVGRGYLPEGKDGSEIPDGMRENEFCEKYNCKKAQKVIVKFNLKE